MLVTPDRRKAFEFAQAREREMRRKGEIDVLEDVARSGLTGVGEGVAGVVGLPMAAIDMATRGGDWVGRKAGVIEDTPEHRAWLDTQLKAVDDYLPTSDETLQAMNGYTRGFGLNSEGLFKHQPRTTAGKYARTMGELAPSFVTGPAGLARKGAMWLGSSLASEAAGQLAEGTGYEDLARLGASVLTGGRPRLGRPGPRMPHPTKYWDDLLDEAEARIAKVGERNPERFADALRQRQVPAAQAKKGAILDEAADPSGKMTPEGIRHFSPSEQAAVRRAGGDDLVERTSRWVERKSALPLPFPDEIERFIKNVKDSSKTGGQIGGSAGLLLGDASTAVTGGAIGTLIGGGVGALPTLSRASGPAAALLARATSNRNVRNAEREIRNGVKPGADRAEARQTLIRALLQNERFGPANETSYFPWLSETCECFSRARRVIATIASAAPRRTQVIRTQWPRSSAIPSTAHPTASEASTTATRAMAKYTGSLQPIAC